MKNYQVTGYQMTKNEDTWEMEQNGELMTINISSAIDEIEFIEREVSIKMNFDWFEAVTILLN
jgi:hypothetical protein